MFHPFASSWNTAKPLSADCRKVGNDVILPLLTVWLFLSMVKCRGFLYFLRPCFASSRMVVALTSVSKCHQDGIENLAAFENPKTCDVGLHTTLEVVILWSLARYSESITTTSSLNWLRFPSSSCNPLLTSQGHWARGSLWFWLTWLLLCSLSTNPELWIVWFCNDVAGERQLSGVAMLVFITAAVGSSHQLTEDQRGRESSG